MKMLTEFSTLTLRKAAAARAAAGGARTSQAEVSAAEAAPAEDAPAAPPTDAGSAEGDEAAVSAEGDESAVSAEGDESAVSAEGDESAVSAASAEGEVPAGDADASEATPSAAPAKPADPAIDAVAAALAVQPDRAARLLEALDIVGGGVDQVRLVRVYQGEAGPTGSVSRGEFHYVIDRVAGAQRRPSRDEKRDDRGGRGGGGGGGGGGGRSGGMGGMGGPGGGRDKPRGLGSFKAGAKVAPKDDDDRGPRGEQPKAGIGWQLTAAPRDSKSPGRGGPRAPGGPRGPRAPGGPRGPGGAPGGDNRGPRRDFGGPGGGGPGSVGPGGGRGPGPGGRGPGGRPVRSEPRVEHRGGPRGEHLGPPGERSSQPDPQAQQAPRLGPDGLPLAPRSKRPRKPIGPDENGMGPDGKPWDPARRAQRLAEPGPHGDEAVNTPQGGSVDSQTDHAAPQATSESHGANTPTE